MIDCSIVIPIYNPEKDVEDLMLSQYDKLIRSLPELNYELIIVDDGSKESISHILDKLRLKFQIVKYVQHDKNKGKGKALRSGVEKTSGEIILYTDYDFPYQVDSMKAIIHSLQNESTELAIGIRPESYYSKIPKRRKQISKNLQRLNAALLKLPTGDTQAGLKGFKKSIKPIFLQTTTKGFLFDLEFLKMAHARGLKTELVEIELREDVVMSEVKTSHLFKELVSYARVLFRRD
jgi:glycosyltransferase involved in cell wall biosynthesis